ncbi:calcium-binding protein CBP-like [Nymphaea colorata]|nr:calcium-binding protein CBP-like [Nymphaea colorata]
MAYCQNSREDEMNDPFGFAMQPCTFPPGTDQKIIHAFDAVDKDCNGYIEESELRTALSKCNQTYTARTIRFFMCAFSKDTTRIGPTEFVDLFNSLKNWRDVFCRTDRNRDGIVDANELRTALNSLGFPVSPKAVNFMIATYTREKSSTGVSYDKFIECCAIVKGLSERFKWQENCPGSATFTYELFMQAALMFTAA